MKTQIKLSDKESENKVILDGVNYVDSIKSVTLHASPNERRLVVEAMVWERVDVEGEMTVEVPQETHELLVKMGWTPPKERA